MHDFNELGWITKALVTRKIRRNKIDNVFIYIIMLEAKHKNKNWKRYQT